MPVTLRDARDSPLDRDWIRAVYRGYLSDLSSSQSGVFPALDWGSRESEFLSSWFADPRSHPFVILQRGAPVGFALVSRPSGFSGGNPADYRLAEFFIVESARRRGVGTSAVELLFSRFAGEWEVLENESNPAALSFWRRVIAAYTQGRFAETRLAGEVRHRFRTPRAAPPGAG